MPSVTTHWTAAIAATLVTAACASSEAPPTEKFLRWSPWAEAPKTDLGSDYSGFTSVGPAWWTTLPSTLPTGARVRTPDKVSYRLISAVADGSSPAKLEVTLRNRKHYAQLPFLKFRELHSHVKYRKADRESLNPGAPVSAWGVLPKRGKPGTRDFSEIILECSTGESPGPICFMSHQYMEDGRFTYATGTPQVTQGNRDLIQLMPPL